MTQSKTRAARLEPTEQISPRGSGNVNCLIRLCFLRSLGSSIKYEANKSMKRSTA